MRRGLDVIENKDRAAGDLLLQMARLDPAGEGRQVESPRHRHREGRLQRAERNVVLPVGVGAVQNQRTSHSHRNIHAADVILYDSLQIRRLVRARAIKAHAGLVLKPLKPVLTVTGLESTGRKGSCHPDLSNILETQRLTEHPTYFQCK